jgi:hypothetical protein
MEDVNKQLNETFSRLTNLVPDIPIPTVYAQIGALDQSVVVGNQSIGISLDKYLGSDYSLYKRFYTPDQRKNMNRQAIVPDCLSFYILSLYPLKDFDTSSQLERDMHMGKIQWVTNRAMKKNVFNNNYVKTVGSYMRRTGVSVEDLLKENDYDRIIKISGIAYKKDNLQN